MSLPHVRFTVRRMMVVVVAYAVVFALLAAFPGWAERRRSRFQITCEEHTWDHRELGGKVRRDKEARDWGAPDGDLRRLEYFSFMKEKYSRAARTPWLPVWPDPPGPR